MRARRFPDKAFVRRSTLERPEQSNPGPMPLKGRKRTNKDGKSIGGRNEKWRDEFVGICVQLYGQGWTMVEIAQLIGVAPNLLRRWRQNKPELKRAMDEAHHTWRTHADDRVVRSLYERAIGYSWPDEDIKVIDGQVVRVHVVRHIPPDVKAAEIWLLNRRAGEWRARQEVVYSSSDDPRQLTDEELMEIVRAGTKQKQTLLPPPRKSGNGSTH